MASLSPRHPYTQHELDILYPSAALTLEHVQIILRHGERTPTSPRFRNTNLPLYWPYCHAAKQLRSVVATGGGANDWDELTWRRRLETFSKNDLPIIAEGPDGEYDGICTLGEITDVGRATTTALGARLRHLYVDQLAFMPAVLSSPDSIYLRATPMPRALESVQQAFIGMYPPSSRTAGMRPPTIVTRSFADETLFPNGGACKRLGQLVKAFADRTAGRWNDSEEMNYLNRRIGKWMPEDSPRVAVDSRPRMSGIMDTVNATLAHGPATRLPGEFYDKKVLDIIDTIAVEEWYAGYKESQEYRTLGIGPLAGDIVTRMVGHAARTVDDGIKEIGGEDGELGKGRQGESAIKFAMSGAHDTTLAALLTSLGAFEGQGWPKFTSHLAVELFSKRDSTSAVEVKQPTPASADAASNITSGSGGWWSSLFGTSSKAPEESKFNARKPTELLTQADRDTMHGYYVRIRYNDQPVVIPGCKAPGKHLDGDESFCTLEAFKAIVDKYTPQSWKRQCSENLDKPGLPDRVEEPGYE